MADLVNTREYSRLINHAHLSTLNQPAPLRPSTSQNCTLKFLFFINKNTLKTTRDFFLYVRFDTFWSPFFSRLRRIHQTPKSSFSLCTVVVHRYYYCYYLGYIKSLIIHHRITFLRDSLIYEIFYSTGFWARGAFESASIQVYTDERYLWSRKPETISTTIMSFYQIKTSYHCTSDSSTNHTIERVHQLNLICS